MILPNNVSRCDGLLARHTNLGGWPAKLWAFDCPMRESCRRFLAMDTDNPHAPIGTYSYLSHHHAPGEECPDFIHHEEEK